MRRKAITGDTRGDPAIYTIQVTLVSGLLTERNYALKNW